MANIIGLAVTVIMVMPYVGNGLPSNSVADGNWKIGGSESSLNQSNESWDSEIDEMSFWNEALTQSDVTSIIRFIKCHCIAYTDATFPEKSNIIARYYGLVSKQVTH